MDSNQNAMQQLNGKKRSYDDLSRFIGSRATPNGAPNYTFLLGAGCSVSSNVRSAGALVEQWRKEIFSRLYPGEVYDRNGAIEKLSKNNGVWYNPLREYSSLFEKNFDLPRQRRMFVEQEVSGKSPNLGYAYLIKLIEEGYVNTLFTTNFDDLINEAFFQFSGTRPIVCAHDSSIGSVTVTSKRPKVIKLHGDYLFDDIKATVRETESLEDNTRKKFIEFGRDFGLVVVGYGGTDRSLMDVLQYLLRSDDYFKHGVYWCMRKDDVPSDELLKLLWRDRVYFVEIEGFDELMAALHNDLVGSTLPIDTSIVTSKPRAIITGFCENTYLNDSVSKIIKRDLDRLKKQDERERLLSAFRDIRKDEYEENAGVKEELEDREIVTLLEIKQQIGSSDFSAARERIVLELGRKPNKKFKEELADLRVTVEDSAGDLNAAVAAVDDLISDDPREPENYIRKTYLITQHSERIRILDIAAEFDPYYSRIYNRKVSCFIDAYTSGAAGNRKDLLASIWDGVSKSLECDPGSRNNIWDIATDFYAAAVLEKDTARHKLDELIEKSSTLGPNKLVALRARLGRLSLAKSDRQSEASDKLIKDISEYKLKKSKSLQPYFEWLELDAYKKLDRKDELSRRLSELELNPDLSVTREYLKRKADFLGRFTGDLQGAIGAYRQAIKVGKARQDVMRLADLLELAKDSSGIVELTEEYGKYIRALDKILLKRSECEAKGDINGALALLRSTYTHRLIGAVERVEEVHDLLRLKMYGEAITVAKSALDSVAWNKYDFSELIVNYELAELRNGGSVNKGRLGEIIDVAASDESRACAYYLIGNLQKTREILQSEIRKDRLNTYRYKNWAIFLDDKGKEFLVNLIKSVE